jgi:hypothetical protein
MAAPCFQIIAKRKDGNMLLRPASSLERQHDVALLREFGTMIL